MNALNEDLSYLYAIVLTNNFAYLMNAHQVWRLKSSRNLYRFSSCSLCNFKCLCDFLQVNLMYNLSLQSYHTCNLGTRIAPAPHCLEECTCHCLGHMESLSILHLSSLTCGLCVMTRMSGNCGYILKYQEGKTVGQSGVISWLCSLQHFDFHSWLAHLNTEWYSWIVQKTPMQY